MLIVTIIILSVSIIPLSISSSQKSAYSASGASDAGNPTQQSPTCKEDDHGLDATELTIYLAECPAINLSRNNSLINGNVAIASSNLNIYVTWDVFNSTEEVRHDILFTRSTDNGNTFEPTVKINVDYEYSQSPQIAAIGPYVFIGWEESGRNLTSEVFFTRSSDYGETFQEPVNLSRSPTTLSSAPKMVVVNNNIYITWVEMFEASASRGGAIYFVRSTDTGTSFSNPAVISDYLQQGNLVAIDAIGDNVFVVWDGIVGQSGVSDFGPSEILFARSRDRGLTFGDTINLSKTPDYSSSYQQIAKSGNDIILLWDEHDIGSRLARSSDYGKTFEAIEDVTGGYVGPLFLSASDSLITSTWCNSSCFLDNRYSNLTMASTIEFPGGCMPIATQVYKTDSYVIASCGSENALMLLNGKPNQNVFYDQVSLGNYGFWGDNVLATMHLGKNLYVAWHGSDDNVYFKRFYLPLNVIIEYQEEKPAEGVVYVIIAAVTVGTILVIFLNRRRKLKEKSSMQ
jgi:hypothetical protein